MGIRRWFRNQLLGQDAEGNDVPPGASLMATLLGREEERVRSLGEYDATNYPQELSEQLRRRTEVSNELLQVDVTDRKARIAAIPRLQQLLRRYPHPLAYDFLIHAYCDAGRWDEAKGIAYASRERRLECERSPHPEIRGEVERLGAWSPDDVEELRKEAEARPAP